ncbi:MAG: hypothetical protein R3A51_16485 [Nannocystaceae bacterium]
MRAFYGDGSTMWVSPPGIYCDSPSLADLDGDGVPEVVLAGTVLDSQTGAVKFVPVKARAGGRSTSSRRRRHRPRAQIVTGSQVFDSDRTLLADTKLTGTFPAVADLNDDGQPEIVVVANIGKNSFVHHLHVWQFDEKRPGNFKIVRQGVDINSPLPPSLLPQQQRLLRAAAARRRSPSSTATAPRRRRRRQDRLRGLRRRAAHGSTPQTDTLVWIKQTQDCSSSFTGARSTTSTATAAPRWSTPTRSAAHL